VGHSTKVIHPNGRYSGTVRLSVSSTELHCRVTPSSVRPTGRLRTPAIAVPQASWFAA